MSADRRVSAFLAIADEELGAAKLPGEKAPRQSAYLLQQAAEKATRALLTRAGIPFGTGHNLADMAMRLPADHPLRAKAMALDRLSGAATRHRYPTPDGHIAPPPRADVLNADLADVARFVDEAKRHVGLMVGPPEPLLVRTGDAVGQAARLRLMATEDLRGLGRANAAELAALGAKSSTSTAGALRHKQLTDGLEAINRALRERNEAPAQAMAANPGRQIAIAGAERAVSSRAVPLRPMRLKRFGEKAGMAKPMPRSSASSTERSGMFGRRSAMLRAQWVGSPHWATRSPPARNSRRSAGTATAAIAGRSTCLSSSRDSGRRRLWRS